MSDYSKMAAEEHFQFCDELKKTLWIVTGIPTSKLDYAPEYFNELLRENRNAVLRILFPDEIIALDTVADVCYPKELKS